MIKAALPFGVRLFYVHDQEPYERNNSWATQKTKAVVQAADLPLVQSLLIHPELFWDHNPHRAPIVFEVGLT